MMEDKNSLAFLDDLATQIGIKLSKKLAIAPDKATDIGIEVADEVRRLWGGVSVYICKTDQASLEAKYNEIFETWKKEGFSRDLFLRFGLSEQRVRQIVAAKRQENCIPYVKQRLLA